MENNFYRYEKRNDGGAPRGFEPRPPAPQAGANRFIIDYPSVKADFIEFLKSRRLDERYIQGILSYLDKYVKVIREASDVVRVFSGLTAGQQHHLNRAIRNLFNFYEA